MTCSKDCLLKASIQIHVDIFNPDYLVIDTGYIHRINKEEELDDLNKMIAEEYGYEEDSIEEYNPIRIFSIVTYSDIIYTQKKEDSDKVHEILSLLKGSNITLTGAIIFRVDNISRLPRLIKFLRMLEYCACLHFENITEMRYISSLIPPDNHIVYCHIDAESG